MQPGLVVLAGLPGAGKSTLARALADRLPDARILDRDAVRDALFDPADATAAERTVTFTALLDATRYHLSRGRVVILDGVPFLRRHERGPLREVVADTGAFLAHVVCDVPVAVAEGRERDADLVRRFAAEMEEPDGSYVTVDMTGALDRAADEAFEYVVDCAR